MIDASHCAGNTPAERSAAGVRAPGTTPRLSWDKHRWVRQRRTLAALGEQLERFGRAWRSTHGRRAVVPGLRGPAGARSVTAGYRFASDAQRALAVSISELLAGAGERSEAAETPIDRGSPRPEPAARIVPGD